MKILQQCFTVVFVLVISLPFVLTLFDVVSPVQLSENRVLAQKPHLNKILLKAWPKTLDPWFQEQLAFRNYFVSFYLWLWEGFLQSTVKSAVTGRSKEWFLSGVETPLIQYYLGLQPLTKEHLVNLKLVHSGTYAFLKSYGIPYFLITIPDKTSLYPERLPFWTHWNKGESIYEQITPVLKESNIPWIDMLPILQTEKIYHDIYNKTFDTMHWNGYGAEIAYELLGALLSQFDKGFSPKPMGVYYTISLEKNMFSHHIKETVPVLHMLQVENLQLRPIVDSSNENPTWRDTQLIVNKAPLTPYTVWLVSDSYFLFTHQEEKNQTWTSGLPPIAHHTKNFLKMHFINATIPFFKKFFNTEYSPDVVLETFVERNFNTTYRARDPLLRVFGEIHLNTPGHIITPANISDIVQDSNCVVRHFFDKKDTVFLDVVVECPFLQLRPVTTDGDGRAMVIAHMFSPVATTAELYYAPKGTNTFTSQQIVTMDLVPGKNMIHFSFIAEPYQEMDLCFHPGRHIGSYKILPMPKDVQRVQTCYSD